jgi:hypothetical protein
VSDATLDALVALFREARASAERFAVHVSWAVPQNTCRYCGRHWKRWAGSQVDGHAACIVGDAFKAHLARVLRGNARLTYARLGVAFSISPSIIRSWVAPRSDRGRDALYLRRGPP